MYEQFMSDFTHRDSSPWQVQLLFDYPTVCFAELVCFFTITYKFTSFLTYRNNLNYVTEELKNPYR